MNKTNQRLDQLAANARLATPAAPDAAPHGFATRVLALARDAGGGSDALWLRFSLASLPLAGAVVALSLWWAGDVLSTDADDLARVFLQSHLLP